MTWFSAERARGYSVVLLIALLPLVGYFYGVAIHGTADFLSFWSAGRLAWTNPVAAYDPHAVRALQAGIASRDYLPFVNPPPFLAVVAPFGLPPLWLALPLFVLATGGAYLAAVRGWLPVWPAIAFTPVFLDVAIGQNGLLTGALLLGGARLLTRRPVLAGVLWGALVIKPQLAVLLPVALIAGGRWRTVAGAAISSLGLLFLSALLFGPAILPAFLGSLSHQTAVVFGDQTLTAKMQSVLALALSLGAAPSLAWMAQAVGALAAATLVAIIWRSDRDAETKSAVLALGTVFATPYLYSYDLVFLILPLVWLARQGADEPRAWERPVIGLAALSPLLSQLVAISALHWNPGPLVHLALLVCVMRRLLEPQALAVGRPAFST